MNTTPGTTSPRSPLGPPEESSHEHGQNTEHARLDALTAAGVSIWLDDLGRDRLVSGELARLITDRNLSGVTTNPTIFAKAITGSDVYSTQLTDLAASGVNADDALITVTTEDVRTACDVMRPVYDATDKVDGRVSIEVDPRHARDTHATIEQARMLWQRVDRPNMFVKIPAALQGLEAISTCLSEGISINVTLLFSLDRYAEVQEAFLTGIEGAKEAGLDLSAIGSVASFFVSRVDKEIDARLDAIDSEEAEALRGRTAIANARLAYEKYEEMIAGPRWRALAEAGAHPQRLLWASTGTKDPAYSDTRYVTCLVAPDVVSTMPQATLEAVADHALIPSDSVRRTYPESRDVLNRLARVGVDYDDVVSQLEDEGIAAFEDSWSELTTTVEQRLTELA